MLSLHRAQCSCKRFTLPVRWGAVQSVCKMLFFLHLGGILALPRSAKGEQSLALLQSAKGEQEMMQLQGAKRKRGSAVWRYCRSAEGEQSLVLWQSARCKKVSKLRCHCEAQRERRAQPGAAAECKRRAKRGAVAKRTARKVGRTRCQMQNAAGDHGMLCTPSPSLPVLPMLQIPPPPLKTKPCTSKRCHPTSLSATLTPRPPLCSYPPPTAPKLSLPPPPPHPPFHLLSIPIDLEVLRAVLCSG